MAASNTAKPRRNSAKDFSKPGARELRSWLKSSRTSLRVLASELGVSHSAVAFWARGIGHPAPEVAQALEALSDGAVHACCLRGVGHHG